MPGSIVYTEKYGPSFLGAFELSRDQRSTNNKKVEQQQHTIHKK